MVGTAPQSSCARASQRCHLVVEIDHYRHLDRGLALSCAPLLFYDLPFLSFHELSVQ